jgi:hypothetical protein
LNPLQDFPSPAGIINFLCNFVPKSRSISD